MGNAKKEYVVGVDLGGTKIYAAVVNKKGKILASARKKTKHEQGFETTVQRMARTVHEAIEAAKLTPADIKAVGVGSPGPLDLNRGVIIDTPNLKWKDAPLRDELQKLLKKAIAIDNDGNVGILGEWAYGAAKGAKDVIGLFVGTGIGGGVIIGGKLLHGYNQNAGELGHVILDPNGPQCG
ncbi:ROK family protein, partial [candidate division KSB1 bacterium]|nr:ROK family protein [candidate division KSB1 bacterium]